jgi:hypothetical protein
MTSAGAARGGEVSTSSSTTTTADGAAASSGRRDGGPGHSCGAFLLQRRTAKMGSSVVDLGIQHRSPAVRILTGISLE